MELILASTSPYRRSLLGRLGVPFRWIGPNVDEDAWKAAIRDPVLLAETLAKRKAEDVLSTNPKAVVIGSDQLAALGDEILGKPGTKEKAVAQLQKLSGREHRLVTAVCVSSSAEVRTFTDVTTLQMRRLDREAIMRYVDRDDPVDCAGAYKLEAGGIALFESIRSEDFSAITGLPLLRLSSVLVSLGFVIP